MPGFKGRSILLTWGAAAILGVREKSIALNGEAVDISSDDDAGWRNLLSESGEDQVDIGISGVTKSNVLKADWFNGDRIKAVEIEYPNGDVLAGQFRLGNYTDTGPYKDATTFDATLQSVGVVTFTPYA